jgi:glycosyltransferase involved in cell wall biosynthesis
VRVLHCIHSLVSGGAERQVCLLAEHSSRHGMEAAILCVNDSGNEIADPSVRIYRTARQNKYNLSLFPAINQAVRDFNPDILHAWLPAAVTVPTLLTAKRHALPVVFSYRNRMSFVGLRTLAEFLVARAFASGVAANSPVAQSSAAYRWLYRQKRSVTIPNAVAVGATTKVRQWSGEGTLRVLFVGRLTAQKNLACLLQAVASLKSSHSVSLTLCGEGEDRQRIEVSARRLGIESETTLTGYCHEVYRVMCQHDVLVLPSLWEGMPNVLLEALALGLPSIVSDIPAHRSIVGTSNCAFLFEPRQPAHLAARLMEFANSRERVAHMVDTGRHIANAYTPAAMTERYRDYYSSLVADYRRANIRCA